MLREVEQRNRELWEGHSSVLEDFTHVIGGVGLGLVLYPILRRRSRALGYALLMASAALHLYADTVKPSRSALRQTAEELAESWAE